MGRLGTAAVAISLFALLGTLLSIVRGYDPAITQWNAEVKRFVSDLTAQKAERTDGIYLAGAGKADITGPVVELNLMGYAMLEQIGTGLRQRLFARAFIYGEPDTDHRICYIVLDNCMGDTAIRNGILEGLAAAGGDYAKYEAHNVAVIGTHSHAGPGGWLNYLLPQVTNLGFDKQSYSAIVDGAVKAIKAAHDNLKPARLTVGSAEVQDGNTNRSPWAYLGNPESERQQYKSDVDTEMTLLKAERVADNKTTSVLTWFPVHGTSLYNNNTLVAADNKGVAAWLFERSVANDTRFADDFVSGFSQANVGDTSPNVLGAYCEDGSNQKCDFVRHPFPPPEHCSPSESC
ncbi:hypothetical protein KEM52_006349 [Ascosphaera acerosa]|nr:hypothetical protein KEM52_006349 [Ascosphaera acerosa]